MNKNQRQRIIIFVGHPVEEDEDACEELGKRLKRNNVNIDIINFANPDNVPKLQALINAANNSDNSHFLDVPIGVSMITDVLFTSPILHGDDVAAGIGGGMPADGSAGMVVDGPGGPVAGGGQFAEFGGINPDMDPELAMALKVSMEEERARQTDTNVGGGDAAADADKPADANPGTAAATGQQPA